MTSMNKTGSFGTTAIWFTFGNEALASIFDCRWLIVLCFIMMIADLWWAYSEHVYHIVHAKTAEERKKFEWRKSRAIRRTAMKLVDYITLMVVGVVIGLAITEPLGLCDHVVSAAIGGCIGVLADLLSIIGHLCVVREWKMPRNLFRNFFIALVKTKSEDIGNAIDESFKEE